MDCEEFSDEEAEYYNERIENFENNNYEGTRKVDLNHEKIIKNKIQK